MCMHVRQQGRMRIQTVCLSPATRGSTYTTVSLFLSLYMYFPLRDLHPDELEGDEFRLVVLFVFAWVLSSSVCVISQVHSICVLYMCVCLLEIAAQPHQQLDLGIQSCSSLASIRLPD